MGSTPVAGYEPVVAVNNGTIDGLTSGLAIGKTLTVAGVSDQCTPMPSITFSSDNTSVATVGSDGTVTGIAEGVAHIQATDAKGYSAAVPFTVYVQGANDPTIQSAALSSGSLTVTFDKSFTTAPAADEFIVYETGAQRPTPVQVSSVSLSSDGKTVTLALPQPSSADSSSSTTPSYSVSFMDHTAVTTVNN